MQAPEGHQYMSHSLRKATNLKSGGPFVSAASPGLGGANAQPILHPGWCSPPPNGINYPNSPYVKNSPFLSKCQKWTQNDSNFRLGVTTQKLFPGKDSPVQKHAKRAELIWAISAA